MRLDPQRDTAMMYPKMSRNAPQIHSVHVPLHRLLAKRGRIPINFRFGGVFTLTEQTFVALTTRRCFTGSVLLLRLLAMGTSGHSPDYPRPTYLATPRNFGVSFSLVVIYKPLLLRIT